MKLEPFYAWFQHVATHPGGLDAGVAGREPISTVVAPSAELTSEERLGIYANMYAWRLVDILVDELPTTRHLVGADAFARLARAYVAAHPSTSFTLARFGARFPAFLRDEADDVPHRDVAVDVATMERTIEEVFSAPHVEPLAPEEVADVPPEAWADTGLALVPALRLLDTRYPANEYVRAARHDEDPPVPRPEPCHTVVWRREWRVWRRDLSVAQHAILAALAAGETLGAALAAAADHPDVADEELAQVGAWFQDWTREGMFAALRR